MKKFTFVLALMASVLMLNAQNPMLPNDHGLSDNQPAWLSNQVQVFSPHSGFNWWSSYIDLSNGGLSLLENALGEEASLIKSNDNFVTYDNESETWSGTLMELDNSKMYILLFNGTASEFQLEGSVVAPAEVSITVNKGWNWIGYPCSSAIAINDALANFNANDNDQIKSQDQFASYSAENGVWYGVLKEMQPGKGYTILSNGSSSTSFYYGNASKDVVTTNIPKTIWTANPSAYAQNMTLIGAVSLQGIEVNNGEYELGVFHGDECRGATPLIYVGATNSYLAFLTAYGNEGDELQFRLLDRNTNDVYTAANNQRISYSDNATFGQLDSPYHIEFREMLSTEETLAGLLNIYPNPMSSNQELHIMLPENVKSNVKVQIVNLLGQVTLEETMNGNSCTISGLASGLYTVRVLSDNTLIHNDKLIVK